MRACVNSRTDLTVPAASMVWIVPLRRDGLPSSVSAIHPWRAFPTPRPTRATTSSYRTVPRCFFTGFPDAFSSITSAEAPPPSTERSSPAGDPSSVSANEAAV
jgi:hypothetical protein